jgi:hypothetical protein
LFGGPLWAPIIQHKVPWARKFPEPESSMTSRDHCLSLYSQTHQEALSWSTQVKSIGRDLTFTSRHNIAPTL